MKWCICSPSLSLFLPPGCWARPRVYHPVLSGNKTTDTNTTFLEGGEEGRLLCKPYNTSKLTGKRKTEMGKNGTGKSWERETRRVKKRCQQGCWLFEFVQEELNTKHWWRSEERWPTFTKSDSMKHRVSLLYCWIVTQLSKTTDFSSSPFGRLFVIQELSRAWIMSSIVSITKHTVKKWVTFLIREGCNFSVPRGGSARSCGRNRWVTAEKDKTVVHLFVSSSANPLLFSVLSSRRQTW